MPTFDSSWDPEVIRKLNKLHESTVYPEPDPDVTPSEVWVAAPEGLVSALLAWHEYVRRYGLHSVNQSEKLLYAELDRWVTGGEDMIVVSRLPGFPTD